MKGNKKMPRLKFRQEKGVYILQYDGREIICPTLRDGLESIFHRKFMALVQGKPIGVHNDTLYPVNSLLPPVVEKVAKFYDLGAEIR